MQWLGETTFAPTRADSTPERRLQPIITDQSAGLAHGAASTSAIDILFSSDSLTLWCGSLSYQRADLPKSGNVMSLRRDGSDTYWLPWLLPVVPEAWSAPQGSGHYLLLAARPAK